MDTKHGAPGARTGPVRAVAITAALLGVLLAACGSGSVAGASGTPAGGAGSSAAPAGASIASTLVFGGSAECPKRPFCLMGLEDTYGLHFKDFVRLDVAGPLTIQALASDQIQVGQLFTSDPAIGTNGFVLLDDDRHLQLADNIVPVVRKPIVDANPGVATVLDAVMAHLTQAELTGLNKAVTVDLKPVPDVARAWIAAQGFPAASGTVHGSITVGSTNFYEQEVLGEVFAQVLEAAGATVTRKFQLGNREIVFPALKAGEIDVLAEYAASALEFVDGGAGKATADATATTAAFNAAIAPDGLVALDPAAALDNNGTVVTRATADRFGLAKISDLAKPAP